MCTQATDLGPDGINGASFARSEFQDTSMFQICRVAGIPVRVDAGWLLVFALLSWSLAAGYFPRVLPQLTPGGAWVHGVVAAALLFLSVFLHELAHALVARHHGVRVGGIRLHIFGGVSELESEPPTPRAELLIAAIGPLSSFVIAALCYGLGRAAGDLPWASALTGYLAAVNLVVALFNLVPGFPLDGGRLLHAMLWWWSGRESWATRWASLAGSLFAFGLVALGALRSFTGEVVGGLWFVLIGLFLHRAARSSLALARVRERLQGLRVADAMSPLATAVRSPVTHGQAVASDASAWEAYLALSRTGAGWMAVVEADRQVGLVSRRDLQRALSAGLVHGDVETPARRAA
jgi:Zn-dependent protease